MDETQIVYQAKLRAKELLIAKYGAKPKVLRAIKDITGV